MLYIVDVIYSMTEFKGGVFVWVGASSFADFLHFSAVFCWYGGGIVVLGMAGR